MTQRLLLAALLVACGKGADSTPQTGPTTGTASGTPTGTAPTGTAPTGSIPTGTTASGWVPTKYRVAYGWFGVGANQARPVDDIDLFGTPVQWPLQIAVRLADDSIETSLTPDNHCDVVFTSYDTLPTASWTGDAGAWFALEMPAGAAVSDTNCLDLELHPDWIGPGTRLSSHRWGLLLRDLDPADVAARGGYGTTGTDPDVGKLVGGSWWTDAASGPVGGGVAEVPGVAVGNEVDGNNLLMREPSRDFFPIDAASVPIPGGVTDGFYEVTGLSPWRDASEL